MNAGAQLAMLCDSRMVGGAFHRKYEGRHHGLAWLEHAARARNNRDGTIYGDQSIFVRRAVFTRRGGFAEIPLMEDVEFSRRLRRAGRNRHSTFAAPSGIRLA